MANILVAFDVMNEVTPEKMIEVKVKPGFKYVRTHMIFYIKMDGKFTRKARLLSGGHNTPPPYSITYSSVVIMEIVRLAFIISGMNDLDIFACGIGNTYLNDPCQEKLWTETGS